MYRNKFNAIDYLYFVVLKTDDQFCYKIGRTFYTTKSRTGKNLVQIIGVWSAKHSSIVSIEREILITFKNFEYFPVNVSGRTECFNSTLPWLQVLNFIDMAISSLAEDTFSEGSETTGEVKPS